MTVIEIVDLSERLGTIAQSNGAFQQQISFDLKNADLLTMTCGELLHAISKASDRYNRFADPSRQTSEEDMEWCSDFLAWRGKD